MYFPWGMTSQANGKGEQASIDFQALLNRDQQILQIGGQESLGRGFVQLSN
jgi:CRISPR-associated protein Cmr4